MKLLCPSYFHPTDPAWEKIIQAGRDYFVECIINPNSGAGQSIDIEYKRLCVRLRKAGLSTLGYVSTEYGNRSMDGVRDDILKYSAWYGVESIFLDEAASGLDKLAFYQDLYDHIPGKAVLNHGIVPDPAYLEVGDVLVIFESSYEKHKTVKFPGWVSKYAKSRTAQIVHTAPTAKDMTKAMKKIAQTSGWAYVTDDTLENPYDSLPGYWTKELAAVRSC